MGQGRLDLTSNGASIRDSTGRLETSGQVMAHLKLRSLGDIDAAVLADWLGQARSLTQAKASNHGRQAMACEREQSDTGVMGQPPAPPSREGEIKDRISELEAQRASVIAGQDEIIGGLAPGDTPSEQEQKTLDHLQAERDHLDGELMLENQALQREQSWSGDQLDAWDREQAGNLTGEELDALDRQAADEATGLTGEELDQRDKLDAAGSDLGQGAADILAGLADGGSPPGGGLGGDGGGGGSGGDSGGSGTGGGSGGDSGGGGSGGSGGGSGGDSGGGGSGGSGGGSGGDSGGGGSGGGSGGDGGSGGSGGGGGTAAAEGADDNPQGQPAMPGGVTVGAPGLEGAHPNIGGGVIDPAADNPSGPSGDPLMSGSVAAPEVGGAKIGSLVEPNLGGLAQPHSDPGVTDPVG